MENVEFICTRDGNRCADCLGIARVALTGRLILNNVSEARLGLLTENVKVAAVVEESAPLDDLSCAQRQQRAAKIGVDLAKRYCI